MAFPSVTSLLDGSFPQKDEPSTVYLARLKNHPGFVKLGICQLKFRNMRRGDPEIGQIIWESCRIEDISVPCGDQTRAECWLFEQYILELLNEHVEQIPELRDQKWPGYTETLRISTEKQHSFLEFDMAEAIDCFVKGYDGLCKMLDQVVVSASDRELYRDVVQRWSDELAPARESLNARRIENGEEPLPSFFDQQFPEG